MRPAPRAGCACLCPCPCPCPCAARALAKALGAQCPRRAVRARNHVLSAAWVRPVSCSAVVVQVYANEFVAGFAERHSKYLEHKCDEVPALDVPENWDCWGFMVRPASPSPPPRAALTPAPGTGTPGCLSGTFPRTRSAAPPASSAMFPHPHMKSPRRAVLACGGRETRELPGCPVGLSPAAMALCASLAAVLLPCSGCSCMCMRPCMCAEKPCRHCAH
jgi:hypothetical protein